MNYQERVKLHLSAYKKAKYSAKPNGIWRPKTSNKVLEYAFSQKGEDYQYNVLEPYRKLFYKSKFYKKILGFEKQVIKKHIYFHHMNSSQAMCINFFYPLLVEKQLELVLEYLGFHGETINYDESVFEKDSDIDIQGGHRPTNFDFYIKTDDKEFFFEIKYTEQEFGSAKNDESHRDKYEAVYSDNMQVINPEYVPQEVFFKHYQLIRNLIHIGKDKYVVLLYPEGNKRIHKQAQQAKGEILKSDYQNQLYNVFWKELYMGVSSRLRGEKLIGHMKEFGTKYLV